MNCKLLIFALCTSVLFGGSLIGQDKAMKRLGFRYHHDPLRDSVSKAISFQLNRMMAAVDEFPDPYVGAGTASTGELDAFEKLGVTFREIQESYVRWQLGLNNEMGLFVHKVDEGGLAEKAQLQDGDLIYQVGFGGERINIKNAKELLGMVDRSRNNDLTVFFKRDAVKMKTKIRLEKFNREDYRVGVYVDEMTSILQKQLQVNGVVVTSTTEDGPAKAAGLQADDIVIAIDGVAVESKKQLSQLIDSSGGKELEFQILSGGNKKSVRITPVLVPEKVSHATIESWPIKEFTLDLKNPLHINQGGVWRVAQQDVDGISSDEKFSTLIENVEQLTQQIKKLESEVANLKSGK